MTLESTVASGQHNHTALREKADAVRCKLGSRNLLLLVMADEAHFVLFERRFFHR
jgi:hypothetical protein